MSLGSDESRRVGLLVAAADPIRVALLARLTEPRSVTELCDSLSMAQPRISHHLAILREAGLVEAKRDGRRRLYEWGSSADEATLELQALLRRWFLAGPQALPPHPTPPRAPVAVELEDFLL